MTSFASIAARSHDVVSASEAGPAVSAQEVAVADTASAAVVASAVVVMVQLDSEVDMEFVVVDSSSLRAVEDRMNSLAVAFLRMDMVLDSAAVAIERSAAVAEHHIRPSGAHFQYNSSPSHLPPLARAQRQYSDTYLRAATELRTDSTCMRLPSALLASDHSTAPQSIA